MQIKSTCDFCDEHHSPDQHRCEKCWQTGHGVTAHQCLYCFEPHSTIQHICRICKLDHGEDFGQVKYWQKYRLQISKVHQMPFVLEVIVWAYVETINPHTKCGFCGEMGYELDRDKHSRHCQNCHRCGHYQYSLGGNMHCLARPPDWIDPSTRVYGN
jgi:hypothetical protein